MRVLLFCLPFLLALSGPDGAAFAACQNKVGGVCIDDGAGKPAKKAVKKKSIRKKTVKKKTVPAKKPVVQGKSASSCIQVKHGKSRKSGGTTGLAGLLIRNITLKNHCAETANIYVALSPCRSPKSFFWPFQGKAKKTFKVRAKGRTSFEIAHSESMRSSAALVKINAAYVSKGGGSYPGFGC